MRVEIQIYTNRLKEPFQYFRFPDRPIKGGMGRGGRGEGGIYVYPNWPNDSAVFVSIYLYGAFDCVFCSCPNIALLERGAISEV